MIDYYDYAADEARPSITAMTATPSSGRGKHSNDRTQTGADDSLSSSFDSCGSMNSEEYAMVLDYIANVEGEDDSVLESILKARSGNHFGGMDMDETDSWNQTANDRPPKPRNKSKPARPKGKKKDVLPQSGKSSPAPFSSQSRNSTPKSRQNSVASTPKSHQNSAASTPSSLGKKESKRGRVRASPVPIQQLRDRYSKAVSFVVAVDPMSKLMDEDSLIVVPHSQITTVEVLEAATVDSMESEVSSTSATIGSEMDSVTITLAQAVPNSPSAMDITIEYDVEGEEESEESLEMEESEEDSMEDADGSEEQSEEMEDSNEVSDDYDIEDDEDEYEEDEEFLDDDILAQLMDEDSEEYGEDDLDEADDNDDDDDDLSDQFSSTESEDGEAIDEGRPIVISPAMHTPGSRPDRQAKMDILNMEKDLGISRVGMQMKHDSRRSMKNKDRSRNDGTETGEFLSKKKLSKAEKKKQKKKNRDEVALEYRELETWNELIRDFIQHASLGAPMPFSPMGRFQRKQLHWLSEFYGLRSQSFGSGTRRSTSVFCTKRTVLHDYALSLAAIKAIADGIHPFLVSSADLELDAERLESSSHTPSKRRNRDSHGTPSQLKQSKKKKNVNKSRSPLVKGPSKQSGGRSRQGRNRPPTDPYYDSDEDGHAGLDSRATSSRVVGAGASHIPESNVGHTMLRRLGWTSGGLGKDEQGISQPIAAVIKSGRRGLGA